MIKIEIKNNGSFISYFKVTGHANYDDYGKDIVCAAVSTAVITSCNLALKFDFTSIKVEQKEGLISVKVLKEDEVINTVLLNMVDMLKELSDSYKKNIKII